MYRTAAKQPYSKRPVTRYCTNFFLVQDFTSFKNAPRASKIIKKCILCIVSTLSCDLACFWGHSMTLQ
jgi:hypothetical protein